MFLDQFSTGNPMVPFPRSHSDVITMFGNQTYLWLIATAEALFTAYVTFTATQADHEVGVTRDSKVTFFISCPNTDKRQMWLPAAWAS